MSNSDKLNTLPKPCASCPWRKDSTAADIPNFSLQLAEELSACSPDNRNYSPAPGEKMFACHQSKPDAEFACAGWLAVAGHRHPEVRLAVLRKELSPEALEPGQDWPELHENWPEVMDKLRATTLED